MLGGLLSFRAGTSRALITVLAVAWACVVVIGCGRTTAAPAASPAGAEDNVVERAEGFAERPGWADPNVPFSRKSQTVRVLGYVNIAADQRKDAGFRAADSYARAELVRFLETRVAAILIEKLSTDKARKIVEGISESADLVVDDLSIAAHYWEKVKEEQGERLHLYSRLDLEREQVEQLLSRVWAGTGDMRTAFEDVRLALVEGWDRLDGPEAAGGDFLPEGTYTPDWAKSGDREDDQAFHFVCHGLAADEDRAVALAGRMCSEKLCRLFGVQIKSRTTVREDLEKLEVESEVAEGCLDVRLHGRTTEFNGGDCGPRGCVHWIMQKYPKSAYLAERERLESPTIVERQIVVQEGQVEYKDPAACEGELRAYGAISERGYPEIKKRREILQRALRACEGIDGRDSGLFSRLSYLLQKPLGSFTNSEEGYKKRGEDYYLFTSASWLEQLETSRHFDQKISRVLQLLEDAEPPLLAIHAMKSEASDLRAVQGAVKPLYVHAYEDKPVASTHLVSVHHVHRYRPKGQKDAEFLRFLLEQARARRYDCSGSEWVGGKTLLFDIAAHGSGAEEEWQAGLYVIKHARAAGFSCAEHVIAQQPTEERKMARTRQLLRLAKEGNLWVRDEGEEASSAVRFLTALLGYHFTPDQMLELALESLPQRGGSTEERKKLAQLVLKAHLPKYDQRGPAECGRYLRVAKQLSEKLPQFGFPEYEEYTLCECLKDGFSGSIRAEVIRMLSTTAQRVCKRVRREEWPGGMETRARPHDPPKEAVQPPSRAREGGPRPGAPADPRDVADAIAPAVKQCLSETELETPMQKPLRSYVRIMAGASSKGLSNADVDVRVSSLPNEVDFRDKDRRGWATLADVRRNEQQAKACIAREVSKVTFAGEPNLRQAGASRVWLRFSSGKVEKALLLR